MKKEIPAPIQDALDAAAKRYSESEATTNLGRFGRFLASFISPSFIIKIFAHQQTKK